MKLKFDVKLSGIRWQKFFEGWYVFFFVSALACIIGFSSYVFYTVLNLNKDGETIGKKELQDPFDASIILKVSELLDARAEQFNRLRTEMPSVKNPF